jgi:hypothetical protein
MNWVFVTLIAVLVGFGPGFFGVDAEEVKMPAVADQKDVVRFWLAVERKGEFLAKPDEEKLEFMRRLGRKLAEKLPMFENNVFALAGFPKTDKPVEPASATPDSATPADPNDLPIERPVMAREWNPAQKQAIDRFRQGNAPALDALVKEIKEPTQGLYVKGLIDPKHFGSFLLEIAEMVAKQNNQSRKVKAERIREEVVPFLELMELVAFCGKVEREGIDFQFEVRPSPEYIERLGGIASQAGDAVLPTFIEPESLLAVWQMQTPHSPEESAKAMRAYPQTKIFEDYLASAGLSLEKDIFGLQVREVLVSGNLTPSGEGGIPDVRFIERVADPMKIMAILPGLKQLAMNMGVMAQLTVEAQPYVRVSYFLMQQFALFATVVDDILIITTGKENLLKTVDRIKAVKAGKTPGYAIPAKTTRFWKVRFQNLNEQLQKLLQSPLLANKGIPPVSNLNALNELGDLLVSTNWSEKGIIVRVKLPTVMP